MNAGLEMAEQDLGVMIASAAAGDEYAFARIVAAYHEDMRRVCSFVTRDDALAEDAVQNAWSIIWHKLGSLKQPTRLRAMVAVGSVVARTWRSREPDHGLGPVLAVRVMVVLVVTAIVVAARIAIGPLAAALTGVVGVLLAIVLLILTGYARIPPISRPRQ